MYCPQCRVEYREGFTECSDCNVPLVPVLPPEAPHSAIDLVEVFESTDQFAIALAKGTFEDSDIPFWIESGETASRLAMDPMVFPACRIVVPKDREAEARDVGGAGVPARERNGLLGPRP
jgi:hypothetical protein